MKKIFKKVVIRKIYLFLSSLIFLNKIKIKKYDKFKIKLDITEYTQNALYFKNYDKKIRDFIKPFINGNEIFIDIGANIGFYTLYFSSLLPRGKIFAYEANYKNYIKLKKNIKLNNFKNINSYNLGISSYNGFANLVDTSKYNEGGHYINTDKNQIKDKKVKKIKVYKLDKLLKEKKKKIFIKIDVEGHERHVLNGMKKILLFNKCILMIETGQGNDLIYIKKFLKKYNYSEKKHFGINRVFIKN